MIDRFSLIYSSINISLAFFRLFIIQENFSNDIFRSYTLFIIPALFFVELENIKYDLKRGQNNYKNNSTNFALLVLISLPAVILYINSKDNLNDIYIIVYILTCGAVVDGFINVNTASRKNITNSIILLIRISSLVILYLTNIYYYSFFLIIFVLILNREIYLRRPVGFKNLFSTDKVLNYLLAGGGRLKDWNITYFTQMAITGGENYFYFYIYSKILQNISGFIYIYLRSSLKTDTTKLYITTKNYIRFLYPAPVLIYFLNINISILVIPILAFIENISAQLILYSKERDIQIKLLFNNIICFLILSILYLLNPSSLFIIIYISLCYLLGLIILFSRLDLVKSFLKRN